jgi:hypothetical protein
MVFSPYFDALGFADPAMGFGMDHARNPMFGFNDGLGLRRKALVDCVYGVLDGLK